MILKKILKAKYFQKKILSESPPDFSLLAILKLFIFGDWLSTSIYLSHKNNCHCWSFLPLQFSSLKILLEGGIRGEQTQKSQNIIFQTDLKRERIEKGPENI